MRAAQHRSKYQILLLAGNASSPLPATLRATLETRVKELGLDPAAHLRFADANDAPSLQRNAPWATVYFGTKRRDTTHDALVASLLSEGRFVLPVVRTLDSYPSQVPAALKPINGMALAPGDRPLNAVAARVLEELRLMRGARRVFLSYRRADSRAAALQLFHRLERRGFVPFLDTHRVPTGTEFQGVLVDELADVDMVVFLDTPDALTSTWVNDELERAGHLSVGVVQLVWPGHKRDPVTELAEPVYLEREDFATPSDQPLNATSKFTRSALDKLVNHIESVRARNLAARRARLVETFCKAASDQHIRFTQHPGSHITLRLASGAVRVVPVLGHPRSEHFRNAHLDHGKRRNRRVVLLHDTLGALSQRMKHLRWLSRHLPVRTLAGCEAARWLKRA